MPKYQCNACEGVYVDPQPNGARYFHACPPIAVNPTTGKPHTGKGPVEFRAREGHRDENVVVKPTTSSKIKGHETLTMAKSPGAGRTELTEETKAKTRKGGRHARPRSSGRAR